jgi:hypothetical protein
MIDQSVGDSQDPILVSERIPLPRRALMLLSHSHRRSDFDTDMPCLWGRNKHNIVTSLGEGKALFMSSHSKFTFAISNTHILMRPEQQPGSGHCTVLALTCSKILICSQHAMRDKCRNLPRYPCKCWRFIYIPVRRLLKCFTIFSAAPALTAVRR